MPDTDATGLEELEPSGSLAEQPADVAPAVEERFATDTPLPVSLPSERLLGARDLALAALHEITPASTVGPPAGYLPEADGVISLRFQNRLGGYPGWYWTVSVAQVDDEEPTVLEAELLPGDGALLAPEWVPWAERLAEYRAHQAELAASAEHDDADDASAGSDEELDAVVDDLDADDLDDDELDDEEGDRPRLHAGDLDGVDIDELDVSAAAEGDDADEDDEESDDDDADEDDDSDEDDAEEE